MPLSQQYGFWRDVISRHEDTEDPSQCRSRSNMVSGKVMYGHFTFSQPSLNAALAAIWFLAGGSGVYWVLSAFVSMPLSQQYGFWLVIDIETY